ncbi:hypothetical protein [uncultured Tateyamaria sp.]|uniref:hypothetical protein n=1 Tax=uncultured Tateyamaria sp. TaxID=455651 RepID=UPI0026170F0F|nr:hypothetical protein [uncultured Tateyamaria sp.]
MLDYLMSEVAIAVCLGSVFQEVLHWYNLRTRLHLKGTQRLLRSPLYWAMTAVMMIVSVLGVYFWFDGQPDDHSLRDMFVFGAAFPLIFKSLVKSLSSGQSVELGATPAPAKDKPIHATGVLKHYFGV